MQFQKNPNPQEGFQHQFLKELLEIENLHYQRQISLFNLPNKVFLLIAKYLHIKDPNSFLRTHSHLTYLLTPLLHRYVVLDYNRKSALLWAAGRSHKDKDFVRTSLAKGEDVNRWSSDDLRPALHCAARAGKAAKVKILLKK